MKRTKSLSMLNANNNIVSSPYLSSFFSTDDTFKSYCGIYITLSHKQVNLTNHVTRLVHINNINAGVTDCDALGSPFRSCCTAANKVREAGVGVSFI